HAHGAGIRHSASMEDSQHEHVGTRRSPPRCPSGPSDVIRQTPTRAAPEADATAQQADTSDSWRLRIRHERSKNTDMGLLRVNPVDGDFPPTCPPKSRGLNRRIRSF